MPAQWLNHYTIRVRDLEATKNFCAEIVGLTAGDRPPRRFPRYGLYCAGVPTVPLIGCRPSDPTISDSSSEPAKTARLDHIAFACQGLKEMKVSLQRHGIAYDERVLPRLNMTQLFYDDADGSAVECNFSADETEVPQSNGY